jgi:hypothetical protein
MQTLVDARLREEASRFDFRFGCEACAHFVVERRSCANGYPNRAHLAVPLAERETLEFCKEFELV